MAKLVFLTVLASLAFAWCALERTEATHTLMRAKDAEPPGNVFDGDAASKGKELLESGLAQLKNDSISHSSVKTASDKPGEVIQEEVKKMLQNGSSAPPPAAKSSKTQQPSGEPAINATEKEVLIKEKVKNAIEEMDKDFTSVSVGVEEKQRKAVGLDGETEKETITQEPNSEQEVAVETEPGKGSPAKRNETVVVIEKKNETSPDGTKTKVTETEVKVEPGRKTQKETVLEKKDETSSEPKKEKLTEKEVEIKGEEETKKEVIIEKKGETSEEPRVEKITESELKKEPGKEEVVKKAVVQKQDENGTEKETSETTTVKSVITEQKPDEDKKGTVENVTRVRAPIKDGKKTVVTKKVTKKPSEAAGREASTVVKTETKVVSEKVPINETEVPEKRDITLPREPAEEVKQVSTVEKTETKVMSEKAPTNETEVPEKRNITVPREPAEEVRVEKQAETTIKKSGELPGKQVSTVEKTKTKVVSEKAPANATKEPVKKTIAAPGEPAEEVKVEKKAETTTDKEVKEEVPKPAKKVTPVEKVPPIPPLVPLLPQHVTDGTDESGYEYESVSPSRRCLRPHRHGCRCVSTRIVACRTLEGVHCAH